MPAPYRKLYLLYLKLMDLVLMVGAVGLTITLNYAREDYFRYALDFMSERIRISNALLVFVWHQALNLRGLYLLTRLHLLGEEVREIALAVGSGAVALLVVARVG